MVAPVPLTRRIWAELDFVHLIFLMLPKMFSLWTSSMADQLSSLADQLSSQGRRKGLWHREGADRPFLDFNSSPCDLSTPQTYELMFSLSQITRTRKFVIVNVLL